MWNEGGTPAIKNCLFKENLAIGQLGGGIYNVSVGTDTIVTNCVFSKNHAGNGGGNYNKRGSIEFPKSCSDGGPDYFNCMFLENVADAFGGGAYEEDETKFTNCLFWRNQAGTGGWGNIYFYMRTYMDKL